MDLHVSFTLEVPPMPEDETRDSWTYHTKPKISTSSLFYILNILRCPIRYINLVELDELKRSK